MNKLSDRPFLAAHSRKLLEDPYNEVLWAHLDSQPKYPASDTQYSADSLHNTEDLKVGRCGNQITEETAAKVILLAQKLLDNNNAERAEILCRQSLSITCESYTRANILIKLMDSLVRQNKMADLDSIFCSIEEPEDHPWVLYFGAISKMVSQDYSGAIHLLKYACSQQNLHLNAIDRRLPVLACALSMLDKDAESLQQFLPLIGYSIAFERPRSLLCFDYLAPGLPEVIDAIEGLKALDNSSNLIKVCMLLIGPALGRWNLAGLISDSLMTISECEVLIKRPVYDKASKPIEDNKFIAYLSLMHYLDESSPYSSILEVYQMLSRNFGVLTPSLHDLAENLKSKLSDGYQYKAADAISFYLHLSDDRMPQLFDKIAADFATFNVAFSSPDTGQASRPYRLSDLVPVAEINIDHCTSFSDSVVALIRQAKSLVGTSQAKRIFLLPWLKAGGADKVSLDWINYCSSLDNDNSLVILTENATSEWQYRLASGILVLKAYEYISNYALDEQAYALALLVQYLRPYIVHNINSNLGYLMAEKHGKALAKITNLACHIFCNDRNKNNQWDGYGSRHSALIYSYYKFVFSDNRTFLNSQIDSLCGFSGLKRFPDQICTHIYVPTQIPEKEWTAQDPQFRCFWTGRLDKQKRLDILAKIAERLSHIKFDVYGSIMLDGDEELMSRISAMNNVNMRGKYDSFYELNIDEYDFYVMTSEWEGIPNTLLEAASFGLPIVAPLVGGIHEVLDSTTGFPVKNFGSVNEYCEAIELLYSDFSAAKQRGASVRRRICKSHSFQIMKEELLRNSYIKPFD